MTKKNKFIYLLLTLGLVIPLDQLTKWLARSYLDQTYLQQVGPLFVRWELAENPGAFLSLGAGWSESLRFWVLTVAVFFVLAWALWSLFWTLEQKKSESWGLIFLFVGGLGNLIDRAYKGSVTDFVQVGIGPLQTGIFNIVDMLIMASLFIMLLAPFLEKLNRPKSKLD